MSPHSLVPREDGTRKLAGLFGTEASPDGDTTADKIFHYIPGSVSGGWACPSGGGRRGRGAARSRGLPGQPRNHI